MPATNDTPALPTATDPELCRFVEEPWPHWVHLAGTTTYPRPGVAVFHCDACGITLVD